ncbi:putative glycosyl hydrolase 18 family protein [Lyophyllum shimeji]|uniref:chitinase n=1 Tax=Lyophyllum shimeji TaxID=47721 RepID=A0A9P3PXE2_LYOSH|nr:putative glycosyl hydrolase 18 family protein [Lyophyllum shimeji]
MVRFSRSAAWFTGSLLFALQTLAYDNSRSDNLAVYYGQNSYGATHSSDTANWQKNLATYCQDDTINAFPLAFLNVFFSTGGLPEINMANTCNSVDSGVFPGTNLANCQFMASDIKACQARGKIITLSLGGATGSATFSSDAQAQQFADTVWNLFLGGSSSTRPFGDAVLDGVDLDIEGGSSAGYAAFVTRIRQNASGASKPYYVTAAPQCPYPDAYLGTVLNAVAFDAVYVQYNNWCGLNNYNNPNAWDFGTWDNWAKTTAINKNVKVYIGAPASSSAAGSGYVDAATLGNIAQQTRSQYSSFGGVMLWDASQAYANGRYDQAVKNAMGAGGGGTTTQPPPPTTTQPPPPTSTTTTTPPPTTSSGSGVSCAGVAPWSSTVAYNGGQQVTYNGHLWTAKWWSQADVPGGAAGDWTDNGPCNAKLVATGAATSSAAPAKATGTAPKASASKSSPSSAKDGATKNVRSSRFFRL